MCEHVNIDGTVAIICGGRRSRRKCPFCKKPRSAELQCDWKIGQGKTCDAWICAKCAQEVGPDKHLCPIHQVAYRQWLADRQLKVEVPS
jgi:hypothetical protein